MNPKAVAVVRFSSLGDVVLTTPVFRALAAGWPDARRIAITKSKFAGALANHPAVTEVWKLEAGGIRELARKLRREKVDLILDLHDNFRSFLLRKLSRIPALVYRKDALARRLFVRFRRRSPRLQKSVVDRYLEVAEGLGLPTPVRTPELFPPPPRSPPPLSRILVLQTAFLGDLVLTLPLLDVLRRGFPSAKIVALTTPEGAEVFRGRAEVWTYDKRGAERGLGGRWRIFQRLRAAQFELAILPHRGWFSAFVCWAAKIPRRIGFDASEGKRFLTDRVPFLWGVPDAERNLALLAPLGVAGGSEAPKLLLSPPAPRKKLRLGIAPGSVWPTKRWLPERFAEVARRAVRELGAEVVILGGPNDRPSAEEMISHLSGTPVTDLVGKTSLEELFRRLAELDVFLTNDSGPMHAAAALGIPVVAIFGPTTRELGFFPSGGNHRVVERDLPCRPCTLHGGKRCPLGHFRCMTEIGAEEVFEAVREKLERGRGEEARAGGGPR